MLREWVARLFDRLSNVAPTRRDANSSGIEPNITPPELPDVPVSVAICELVHLRGWLEVHCASIGAELTSSERRAFERCMDRALLDVARVSELEGERRERFVDMLAHDLRAPLGAIVFTTSSLVEHGGLGETQLHALVRIARAAGRMQRMVDELLGFARARSHVGFAIARDRIALDALCRRVVDEMLAAHPGRLVTISSTGDTYGYWDAERIAQAVQNLVGNALTYSPQGTSVRISVRGDDDYVSASVNNVGEPIPAATLARVFHPFQRGERPSNTGTQGGLGLGLYIADQFVRAHGGSIQVTSTRDQGTTFTIRLPRRFHGEG
jgi:signal transduction histidine kinase